MSADVMSNLGSCLDLFLDWIVVDYHTRDHPQTVGTVDWSKYLAKPYLLATCQGGGGERERQRDGDGDGQVEEWHKIAIDTLRSALGTAHPLVKIHPTPPPPCDGARAYFPFGACHISGKAPEWVINPNMLLLQLHN